MDRYETRRLVSELTPVLVVVSPSVLEKTGMGLVREVLARERTSALVIPGHPQGQFVCRSLCYGLRI
jgi:hypothetical protein